CGRRTMVEHDLASVAFPRLDERQMAELERCTSAARKKYRDGETLFRAGQQAFRFFVIRSGAGEIVDMTGRECRPLVVHQPGHFTGDVALLTGSHAVVSAVARGDCEVLEISSDTLRLVLDNCPALSDIILGAFIARRQLLRESKEFTGLRVIGSR